ncbi:MAG: hypothetical protein WCD18_05015 [Thermosynechococcaceae cyanobacterium]
MARIIASAYQPLRTMPPTLAVTDTITTLNQAETQFNLRRANDIKFFPEWVEDLPALTELEQQTLDRIKAEMLFLKRWST